MSAIVISQNDERIIERAVTSVLAQESPHPFEVIVVTSGSDATAQVVRKRFPEVRLVELDHAALPGEARNAGLAVARGHYVSFPGSHVELAPGSLASCIRAHELGYAMVSGSIINGTRTLSGWASYFLDNHTVLPNSPSRELTAPPVRCSYLRDVLVEIGGFPEDLRAGEDTLVNDELFARGYGAYRAHDRLSIHHSPCRNPWKLVDHHFARGRAKGRLLLDDAKRQGRVIDRRLLRSLVVGAPARLRTITRDVWRWGHSSRGRYVLALPLVTVGVVAAWLGTWYEVTQVATRASTRDRRRRGSCDFDDPVRSGAP